MCCHVVSRALGVLARGERLAVFETGIESFSEFDFNGQAIKFNCLSVYEWSYRPEFSHRSGSISI